MKRREDKWIRVPHSAMAQASHAGTLGPIAQDRPVSVSICHGMGMPDPEFDLDASTAEGKTILAAVQAVLDAAKPAPHLDNPTSGPGRSALLVRATVGGTNRAFFLFPAPRTLVCADSAAAFTVPEEVFLAATRQASSFVHRQQQAK